MQLAISTLTTHPHLGQFIQGASGIRKLRVRNTDLRKGKSSGYRLLYYAIDEPNQILYLLLVYVKSDKANVTQ
jgi:mRNA-degrading endonuclease RelE of RelBE toxin-antitoxin system